MNNNVRKGQITYLWMIVLLALLLGVVIGGTLLFSYRNRGIVESRGLVREYGWFEDVTRAIGEDVLKGIKDGDYEEGTWYVAFKVRRPKEGAIEVLVRDELLNREAGLEEWLRWYFGDVVGLREEGGWSELFRYRRISDSDKVLVEFLGVYLRGRSASYGLRRMVALYRRYMGEFLKTKGTAGLGVGVYRYSSPSLLSSSYSLDPYGTLNYPAFNFQRSVHYRSSNVLSVLSRESQYDEAPFSAGAEVYLLTVNVPMGFNYLDLSREDIKFRGRLIKVHDLTAALMSKNNFYTPCGRTICLPPSIGEGTDAPEVFQAMNDEELSDFLTHPSGDEEAVEKLLVSGLGLESSILLEPYTHTKSAYERMSELGLSFDTTPIDGTVVSLERGKVKIESQRTLLIRFRGSLGIARNYSSSIGSISGVGVNELRGAVVMQVLSWNPNDPSDPSKPNPLSHATAINSLGNLVINGSLSFDNSNVLDDTSYSGYVLPFKLILPSGSHDVTDLYIVAYGSSASGLSGKTCGSSSINLPPPGKYGLIVVYNDASGYTCEYLGDFDGLERPGSETRWEALEVFVKHYPDDPTNPSNKHALLSDDLPLTTVNTYIIPNPQGEAGSFDSFDGVDPNVIGMGVKFYNLGNVYIGTSIIYNVERFTVLNDPSAVGRYRDEWLGRTEYSGLDGAIPGYSAIASGLPRREMGYDEDQPVVFCLQSEPTSIEDVAEVVGELRNALSSNGGDYTEVEVDTSRRYNGLVGNGNMIFVFPKGSSGISNGLVLEGWFTVRASHELLEKPGLFRILATRPLGYASIRSTEQGIYDFCDEEGYTKCSALRSGYFDSCSGTCPAPHAYVSCPCPRTDLPAMSMATFPKYGLMNIPSDAGNHPPIIFVNGSISNNTLPNVRELYDSCTYCMPESERLVPLALNVDPGTGELNRDRYVSWRILLSTDSYNALEDYLSSKVNLGPNTQGFSNPPTASQLDAFDNTL